MEFPNLLLETIPLHKINKSIEALLNKYDPSIIFTHHYGDTNRDHQILFQAVLTAARPLPGKRPVEILCFETVPLVNGVSIPMIKNLNQIILSI